MIGKLNTFLARRILGENVGFTIIEVMVAMMVFALISIGVAAGITSTLLTTRDSKAREVAIGIASEQIDAARTASNVFSLSDSTTSIVRSGVQFTVVQSARWVTTTGAGDVCGGGGGPLSYKRVAETVSWTRNSATTQSVTMNSLVAPSTAVSSGNLGTIVVGVSNATGAGNQGVTVTIAPDASNPNGATAISASIPTTDVNGCSYAVNVTPGNYNVTLSKSGNIDNGTTALGTETTAPSKPVSVQAGGTATASFVYDAAQTYQISYVDPNAPTTAYSAPISWSAAMWHGTTYVNAIGTTTVQLFPFATGPYYAAPSTPQTCAMVDPASWSTASGTAVAPADAQYGTSNTNVQIPVQTFTVQLSGSADTGLVATQVNALATPGCSTTSSYTFTGLSSTKGTIIALPYGSYTLNEGKVTTSRGVTSVSTTASVPNVTTATGVSYTSLLKSLTLDPRRSPAGS